MTQVERMKVLAHLEELAQLITEVGDRGGPADRAHLAILANALDVLSDVCDYAEARADLPRALEMFRSGPHDHG